MGAAEAGGFLAVTGDDPHPFVELPGDVEDLPEEHNRVTLDPMLKDGHDGSLFVTSGGVNPTSTIQALALYVADQMKRRLANLFD